MMKRKTVFRSAKTLAVWTASLLSLASLTLATDEWDAVKKIGVLNSAPNVWSELSSVGSFLSSGMYEIYHEISQSSTNHVDMTLTNRDTVRAKHDFVDHLRFALGLTFEDPKAGGLKPNSAALCGTKFFVRVSPFTGYQSAASIVKVGYVADVSKAVSAKEIALVTHYLGTVLDIIADSLRVKFGAFPCDQNFRSFSGTCNNHREPDWGTVRACMRENGFSELSIREDSEGLPNPRDISNQIFAQKSDTSSEHGASLLLVYWGQFLDHDVALTPVQEASAEESVVKIPLKDQDSLTTARKAPYIAFHLSAPCKRRDRAMPNLQTSYVDASHIYGSEPDRINTLRSGIDGQMKLEDGLLPLNSFESLGVTLENAGTQDKSHFVAGDERVNEQPVLAALHTLFAREHNRIAKILNSKFSCFKDEQTFQYARKIVGAQIQLITYYHYLPALLGTDAMSPYAGYKPEIDPTLDSFFATVAYRFGHSMVDDHVEALTKSGTTARLALKDAFFNPNVVRQYGIEALLLGTSRQRAQKVDAQVVDALRNHLFMELEGGGDLVTLNIQRSRDHGIPLYNDARKIFGLTTAKTFADITKDVAVQRQLQAVYGSIDKVESYVGGLAEDHAPGAEVGPLFQASIRKQFEDLRDGDRFYFERLDFPPEFDDLKEIQELRDRSLRLNHIVARNAQHDYYATAARSANDLFHVLVN